MNATISMEGLWTIVNSLSLKNKKWLSNKLLASISTNEISKENEVMNGIVRSVKEARSNNTYPLDSIWEQL